METKILIVGTVPYNEKSTSRAFASYFSGMKRENLAQVFSNTKAPVKGHCNTLYQITDQRLLKRRFHKEIETGKIYCYDELPDAWDNNDLEVGNSAISALYHLGKNKNSLVYLGRKIIWKKKYWCTLEFNRWLEAFEPNCVFLSFSDDFFISEIALYVAKKFDIPIISSIGDDYYFNYSKTISPFYHLYKCLYRALIRKVFSHGGSAIYIGDKIRDKYNAEFNLQGETVYLTSSISRREFRIINRENPSISYFGNIRLGRNESLIEIADALRQINHTYKLHIYSNESDKAYYKMFIDHTNIEFHGSISYADVQKKTIESDILVLVEGFKKKDVDITRYSLSTKVADSLSSGVAILAYGSEQCGAIEYAGKTGCMTVCTEREQLVDSIKRILNDIDYQKKNYVCAMDLTERNHRLSKSTAVFQHMVNKVCKEYKNVE